MFTFQAMKAVPIVPDTGFNECQAIWVGGAGIVQVQFMDNTSALYTVAAGTRLLVRANKVIAAGTTATLMLAEY